MTDLYATDKHLSRQRNIIDPKNKLDRLRRQLNGTGTDQQGLQDVLLGDIILDAAALDTDPRVPLAKLMPVPQIRHDPDRIQARVLRQRRRDDFHCVGKRPPADGFGAGQRACLVGKRLGDFDLGRAAAGDEGFLLDEAADDAEGVVEAALGFVEDEGVGAAADNGDRLARGFDARYFDGAGAGGLDFFDQVGGAELVFGEGVDVGDWFAACALFSWVVVSESWCLGD